ASSPTEFYTLSLHDALPIFGDETAMSRINAGRDRGAIDFGGARINRMMMGESYAIFGEPAEIGSIFLGHKVRPHSVPNHDDYMRSEEHTSELQSLRHLVCRL